MAGKEKFAEADMYAPIKRMLEQQGFEVKGEVAGCDVAAVREGALWVVEMKLHFNARLLLQAMDRLKITGFVFVAVPRPKRENDKNYTGMKKILTKLELGLITVALDSPARLAEIILFPGGGTNKETKASARVKKEIGGRSSDTAGGSKTKVNTAYRERCIKIACLLDANGPLSARELTSLHGCERDAYSLMYSNAYGWFEKSGNATFSLTECGRSYLCSNESSGLVSYYRMKAEKVFVS